MRLFRKTEGFTLIELMVVMAIIGVLAGLVGINITGSRNRAKNAQIVGNMKKIQNGLEQHFSVHQEYASSSTNNCSNLLTGSGYEEFFPHGDVTEDLDLDREECDALTYCLCAQLIEVGGEFGGANSNNNCNFNANNKEYFCIAELQ